MLPFISGGSLGLFPIGTTGFPHCGGVVFSKCCVHVLVLSAMLSVWVVLMCCAYLAGAAAPVLPVWESLRPVFLVVIVVFVDCFFTFCGISILLKFLISMAPVTCSFG